MTASARPIAVHRWWGTRGPDTCELRPATCTMQAAKQPIQRACPSAQISLRGDTSIGAPPSGLSGYLPSSIPEYHSRAYLFLRPAHCCPRRRRTSCVIQTQLAASQQRWCCVPNTRSTPCLVPALPSSHPASCTQGKARSRAAPETLPFWAKSR